MARGGAGRGRRGALRTPKPTTIGEAWEARHAGASSGAIRANSGELYKPGTIRAYEKGMRLRVLPELGAERLADLQRPDVQRFVHELEADGLSGSTIRTTVAAIRAICRRAVDRGDLVANPCNGVKLPRPDKHPIRIDPIRIADPAEAAALIAAVPARYRALWATAMYAGLRRGELQALRWSDVDLQVACFTFTAAGTPSRASRGPRVVTGVGCRSWVFSAITCSSTGSAARASPVTSCSVGRPTLRCSSPPTR